MSCHVQCMNTSLKERALIKILPRKRDFARRKSLLPDGRNGLPCTRYHNNASREKLPTYTFHQQHHFLFNFPSPRSILPLSSLILVLLLFWWFILKAYQALHQMSHNHLLREYLHLRPYVSSEFPYPSASHRRRTRLRPELPSLRETRERAILEPLLSMEIDAMPSLERDEVPSLEIDEEQPDINEEHDVEYVCCPLSSVG